MRVVICKTTLNKYGAARERRFSDVFSSFFLRAGKKRLCASQRFAIPFVVHFLKDSVKKTTRRSMHIERNACSFTTPFVQNFVTEFFAVVSARSGDHIANHFQRVWKGNRKRIKLPVIWRRNARRINDVAPKFEVMFVSSLVMKPSEGITF